MNPLKTSLPALLCASLAALLSLAAAPSAQAASLWWHLEAGSRPAYIQPGTATDMVQQLAVNATGGTFKLAFGENQTPSLPYNVSAPALRAALEALPRIGSGNVEVSGGPAATAPLTITFVGTLADQQLDFLRPVSSLIGGAKEIKLTVPAAGHADGEIYVTAENLGTASAEGLLTLKDTLPPGLEPVAIDATTTAPEGAFSSRTALPCDLATLTCAFEFGPGAFEPLVPYDALEMRIAVNVVGAQTGARNEFQISGSDAPPAAIVNPLVISGEPVPFAVHEEEMSLEEDGGGATTHAATHPFQFTTQVAVNQGPDINGVNDPGAKGFGNYEFGGKPEVLPVGLGKDFNFNLPPGSIGNPSKLAKCTTAQFFVNVGSEGNDCPSDSAVGVVDAVVQEPATVGTVTIPEPIFNLEPAFGEPARFGFDVVIADAPVLIDTSLRSGDGQDYGITANVRNITQAVAPLSSTATFWGVPGDPRHATERGWGCFYASRGRKAYPEACRPSEEPHPPVLFSDPTQCSTPLSTSVDYDSWEDRTLRGFQGAFSPSGALTGCEHVPFSPQIHAEPTSNAATSPTGLNFEINVEDSGLENPNGLVQSQIKKAVVTLPEGFTTNPSVAEGLKACTQAQYESETVDSEPGAGCPNESKVGDVEIESPLIEGKKVLGSLYVAKQKENPYENLLTLYMVVKNRELGVMVKQALKVEPNETTGQLTTTVDNIPQLPFSRFHLEFRSGQRAPLVTPPSCDSNPSEPGNQPYTVKADLYPYSEPETPLEDESSFAITKGPEGQGCPNGGLPPFHPNLEAGTINNAAGTYSPFYTHISRKDSEQEITHFSIKLPPGVVGNLSGVPECSDAAILHAKSFERVLGGGTEEEEHPACPASSEIGHTLVGSGVGNVLAYAPGKLYLAGPYNGSQLSIVSITAARVGPFDLGTVVVRFALKINPETAEVSVDGQGSDPIPHIVDGIPIHLRDIRSYVDRPKFTLNPTGCEPTSTASTVLGSGLNFVSSADDNPITVTSPFQAADCAALGFKPELKLSLKGSTKRGGTPAFKAVLHMPPSGDANIAQAQVTLPHSEFLDNAHIGTVCTRVQFAEGNVPGEKCPAASLYGHAKAISPILSEPLEGPVYLRSTGTGAGHHLLPDLVAALHNNQVNIALDGHVEGVHGGIRNTFEAVPDAPATEFVLEMQGGSKGLLENSTNLCAKPNHANAVFTGHNGKVEKFNPLMEVKCPKGHKKHKRAHRRRHRRHRG